MSLYDELELPKDASGADIRNAHRKKAMKHHPDRGGDAKKFHAIQKAYEVLGDPARRKRYDETGEGDEAPDLRQQALDRLAQVLIGAIDHFEHSSETDIINEMRGAVVKQKTTDRETLAKLRQKIKGRERALRRLKFKGGGPDYFRMMIEADIVEKKRNIESGEKCMVLHDEVLAILAEYEYQAEQGTSYGQLESLLQLRAAGTPGY